MITITSYLTAFYQASVTIEGIKYVVDCGFVKVSIYVLLPRSLYTEVAY